jgi:carbonic anhydrase
MKSFLKTLLLVGSTSAAGYDYKTNGADWPDLTVDKNVCGTGKNQSPIDLRT